LATAFKIYEVDFINLNIVMTSHKILKSGKTKRPDESTAKIIDLDMFLSEEQKENERKTNTRKSTNMMFTNKKTNTSVVCLEDFDLLKVLGRGAFGQVVLAQMKESGKLYAIKILKKKEIFESDQLEHTKTEQRILSHVNHPFLVGLDYAFQTYSRLYFVMEFMKGGEVFTHLKRLKRLGESQAKFYAACITVGLGHLHNSKFIYRDLKLENLLLDEYGYLKLADFGLAKFLSDEKKALTFCGTPEYLSPEVITGKGHTRTTDWWSLGVLLYEMIFGVPPFYCQNQDDMFRKIVRESFVFKPGVIVTDQCKDLINKLLEKDQSARLGTSNDSLEVLSHPWFADIDIGLLLSKKIPPPFLPDVKGEAWLKNFDDEFTNENIQETTDNIKKVDVDRLTYLQKEFEDMNFAKQ
jgi:serum/glucocorticoid-regulated kinase 2